MPNIIIRNITRSTIPLALRVDSTRTELVLKPNDTATIDIRALDQAIRQGTASPHQPVNALYPDAPAEFGVIPVSEITE